jgi:hypothetical protein
VSTFEFGAGLLVLAAVVGVVDDRTLRLPRSVALLLVSFPKLPPAGCDADSCRSLPLPRAGGHRRRSQVQGWRAVGPGAAPCSAGLAEIGIRGVAAGDGRAGGGAWARLYKLPCSINSSARAMTLSGIELSANGSIRP